MKTTIDFFFKQKMEATQSHRLHNQQFGDHDEFVPGFTSDGNSDRLESVFSDSCNNSLQLESPLSSYANSEIDFTDWGHNHDVIEENSISNEQVSLELQQEQMFCLQELAELIPDDFLFIPTSELSILQGATNYVQYLKNVLRLSYHCEPLQTSPFNSKSSDGAVFQQSRNQTKHVGQFDFTVGSNSDEGLNHVNENSCKSTFSESDCGSIDIQDDVFENYMLPAYGLENPQLPSCPHIPDGYLTSNGVDGSGESCSPLSVSPDNMSNVNTKHSHDGSCSHPACLVTDDTANSRIKMANGARNLHGTMYEYDPENCSFLSMTPFAEGYPVRLPFSSKLAKDYPVLSSLLDNEESGDKADDNRDQDNQDIVTDKSIEISKSESTKLNEDNNTEGSALRRPKNGFIRFSVEYRKKLAKQHPKLDNREVSKMLGSKWRKMSYEERKPYEMQFESDIKDLREKHPEWRYAPMKRLSHDLIEPMPSRLRPRETLKRKFLPTIIKCGSGTCGPRRKSHQRHQKSKVKKQLQDFPFESYVWLQCNLCSKWRYVMCTDAINIALYQTMWFCHMNPDKSCNSCFDEEDWKARHEKHQSSATISLADSTSSTEYSAFSSSTSHMLYRKPSW